MSNWRVTFESIRPHQAADIEARYGRNCWPRLLPAMADALEWYPVTADHEEEGVAREQFDKLREWESKQEQPVRNARLLRRGGEWDARLITTMRNNWRRLLREAQAVAELRRKVEAWTPTVNAALHWAEDTGGCHFCGYGDEGPNGLTADAAEHDEDCPLRSVTADFRPAQSAREETAECSCDTYVAIDEDGTCITCGLAMGPAREEAGR